MGIAAVYGATKVWDFALVALVVGHFKHCKFPKLVEVEVVWIFEALILVKLFKFSAFECLLFDAGLDFQS